MKCRWFQFLINRALDDGRPLSSRTERHLAQCAVCRQDHQWQRGVAGRLSADRPLVKDVETSAFLHARVLNQLKREQPAAPSATLGSWEWVAVAGVALVVALWAIPRKGTDSSSSVASNDSIASKPELVSVALLESTARFTSGGNWLLATTNLDQPLQREMDLVISDARTVWHSLTAELVPAGLLANRD